MSNPYDPRPALDVLALRAAGYKNAEIGLKLFISVDAVKSRLRVLFIYLRAYDASHATAIAIAQQLLTPEQIRFAVHRRRPGVSE